MAVRRPVIPHAAMTPVKRWSLRMTIAFLTACLAAGVGFAIPLFDAEPSVTSPEPSPLESKSSIAPQQDPADRAPRTGQLVFSAEQNGQWDLYVTAPDANGWQKLTSDGSSRAPVISRDATRIALESHRDGNWEIYVMDSAGTRVTRVTRVPAFDGRPSWSPDGMRLAFASNRQDDLDIWVMNADGTEARDLTQDSPFVDDAPAWSPDGRWIAFTSWRTNTGQIWVVSPDGKETLNLSRNQANDQSPAWSPDGSQIAFVSDRDGQRAVYVAEFSTTGLKNARRVTFSGWDESPVWSPDGKYLAFISPRPSRQSIYLIPAAGGVPTSLGGDPLYAGSVAWGDGTAPIRTNSNSPAAAPPDVQPTPQTPAKLVPLKDVYLAPSYGQMSDRVSASFLALRAEVKAEAGWDFLGVLSDMTRQLTGECGDGCDILSWHKAGRAVDTRMAVDSGAGPMLEIVREDQLGETYWRIYLRAGKQDGSLGEPLTEAPWDWTYDARWKASSGQGGTRKTIPAGYYVDFTELAREYGWNRISSYDDEELSWKDNITAMEFWHYQKADGLTWDAALRELYSDPVLAKTFDWNALLRGEDPYMLRLKDVPAPANAWRWFALFP